MVKIGDKVRVTGDVYPKNCPRGAICTVVQDYGGGRIEVTVDGGNGFEWVLTSREYEPVTEEKPEYNYADRIEVWYHDHG